MYWKKYIFFDIYNNYIDKNGFLSDEHVHIGNGIYTGFIKNKF
jgi:hypothetical protein